MGPGVESSAWPKACNLQNQKILLACRRTSRAPRSLGFGDLGESCRQVRAIHRVENGPQLDGCTKPPPGRTELWHSVLPFTLQCSSIISVESLCIRGTKHSTSSIPSMARHHPRSQIEKLTGLSLAKQHAPCLIFPSSARPFPEAGFRTDAGSGISNLFEGTWKIRCRAQLTCPAIGVTSPTAILKLRAFPLLAALTSSSLQQHLSPYLVQSFRTCLPSSAPTISYSSSGVVVFVVVVVGVVVLVVVVVVAVVALGHRLCRHRRRGRGHGPAPAPEHQQQHRQQQQQQKKQHQQQQQQQPPPPEPSSGHSASASIRVAVQPM